MHRDPAGPATGAVRRAGRRIAVGVGGAVVFLRAMLRRKPLGELYTVVGGGELG